MLAMQSELNIGIRAIGTGLYLEPVSCVGRHERVIGSSSHARRRNSGLHQIEQLVAVIRHHPIDADFQPFKLIIRGINHPRIDEIKTPALRAYPTSVLHPRPQVSGHIAEDRAAVAITLRSKAK